MKKPLRFSRDWISERDADRELAWMSLWALGMIFLAIFSTLAI